MAPIAAAGISSRIDRCPWPARTPAVITIVSDGTGGKMTSPPDASSTTRYVMELFETAEVSQSNTGRQLLARSAGVPPCGRGHPPDVGKAGAPQPARRRPVLS